MKILYIAHWCNTIYENLFESLIAQGIIVKAVVTKKYSIYDSRFKMNKYIFSKCRDYTALYSLFYPASSTIIDFPDLERIIKQEKPDIIISNLFYMPATWRAARLAKKYDIPFVLQTEIQRWPKALFSKIIEKLLFKIFFFKYCPIIKRIISWTPASQKFISEQSKRTDVHSVLPGIDTRLFRKMDSIKKSSRNLEILMNARYVSYKRHIDAINAINYLIRNKHVTDIRLTLIGSNGPLQNWIKRKIRIKNLQKYVRFINSVSHIQMPLIINKNHILIHPSRNEAIGMAIPEAMACGLPVIASDTTGAQAYINKKSGKIFPTGDYKRLAEAILFFHNKKICEKFSRHAINRINSFSIDSQGIRYINILRGLCHE